MERTGLAVALLVQFELSTRIAEPYPAIQMPAFHGTGGFAEGRVAVRRPEVVFEYEHGIERFFSQAQLLEAYPDSHHGTIMRLFLNATPETRRREGLRFRVFPYLDAGVIDRMTERNQSSLRDWMARRAASLMPGERPVHARVRWYRDRFTVVGTQGTPTITSKFEGELSLSLTGEHADGDL